MVTKLHINLVQGIIDVEGDETLVREVYKDFKGIVSDKLLVKTDSDEVIASPAGINTANRANKNAKTKLRSSPRKTKAGETSESLFNADSPKRDKDLDTSKLKDFYGQFNPRSAPEKILIFLHFLINILEIDAVNTDQIYTCFLDTKEKPPQAFAQAFRDAASKKGFINFNGPNDIELTTKGNNYFEFDLERKVVND